MWMNCLTALAAAGCAPSARLSFPAEPLVQDEKQRGYDTDDSGRVDFALLTDDAGRWDLLGYDDDEDGAFDRLYRLSEYDAEAVPHVVIMLDSISFATVNERYRQGDLPWFHPPAKVIAPAPNMSEVIFGMLLHAAPQPGLTHRYFDRRTGRMENLIAQMAMGRPLPMERLLDYHAAFEEGGLSYLNPRDWYGAELRRVKQTVDDNPRPLTLAYLYSSTGMVCKFGEAGANEVLEGVERLCLQLLHERRGAIQISLLADHGHTYIPPQRVDIAAHLVKSGWRVTDSPRGERDVAMDSGGLVGYAGLYTRRPAEVSRTMLELSPVQMTAYLSGGRVIVRSAAGEAAIERRDGRYRYQELTADVLGYAPVVAQLADVADEDGFIAPDDWLAATADHQIPDAPYRLWQAFHEMVISPPDLIVFFANGYCGGIEMFEWFIDMESTHGGIDQLNSATFVMSTREGIKGPLRIRDVMPRLVPGYQPQVRQ